MKCFAVRVFPLLFLSCAPFPSLASFNYEIERRVIDIIDAFFGVPEDIVNVLQQYNSNGGFTNNLIPSDRDDFGTIAYALLKVHDVTMIFYGDEDGTFMGYNVGGWGTYREPGNSGYDPESDLALQKYFPTCVDLISGQNAMCVQHEGGKSIRCVDDCALELCPTSTCRPEDGDCSEQEEQKETWCRQYEVVPVNTEVGVTGFVPRTYHCHDSKGRFSQTPGAILKADGSLGDCVFADGVTHVNREQVGDFVYCLDPNNDCRDTFVGGYRSADYDPRYRTWYMKTRELQRATWSDPYVFFSGPLGITYGHPIYKEEEADAMDSEMGRKVFKGVMAVDYLFDDLGGFLKSAYGDTDDIVVIYERSEPNYLIASSTDVQTSAKVLKANEELSCLYEIDATQSCVAKRRSMGTIEESFPSENKDPRAELVRAAYQSQIDEGYPQGYLIRVNLPGSSKAYASQASFSAAAGNKNQEWIILVISPVERSPTDTIQTSNGLFGVVCTISGLGFIICGFMLVNFLSRRDSRAVILADWRFTSAFLVGCALLNLTSLTSLGDNTEELCLLRMWAFHFIFACTLSPLFVKVYRMYRMIGSVERDPSIISNKNAFAMTMPIVAIQVIILLVFTILTPPHPEEYLLVVAGDSTSSVSQVVECQMESPAFHVTVYTFELGLLVVGCFLAYAARQVDPGFGQSTELLFSLFNIAFIGVGLVVALFAMDVDQQSQIVLFSLGIFWGTVYSSAAFVVPSLLQASLEMHNKKKTTKLHAANKDDSDHDGDDSFREETQEQPGAMIPESFLSDRISRSRDVFSTKQLTGWSAVEAEDDQIILGSRSISSEVENNDQSIPVGNTKASF